MKHFEVTGTPQSRVHVCTFEASFQQQLSYRNIVGLVPLSIMLKQSLTGHSFEAQLWHQYLLGNNKHLAYIVVVCGFQLWSRSSVDS
jgi:hypothetical protein